MTSSKKNRNDAHEIWCDKLLHQVMDLNPQGFKQIHKENERLNNT